MKKRKTVAEKLLERLKEHPELGEMVRGLSNPQIIRTYCGKNDRACGAWSWFIYPQGNIGSPDNMTDCLKSKKLTWYESSNNVFEISAEFAPPLK
jgi:hypothetical protein